MPLLTVLDPLEVAPQSPPPETHVFREKGGRMAECVRADDGWTLRRLITTDLCDYLDKRLQPGEPYLPPEAVPDAKLP